MSMYATAVVTIFNAMITIYICYSLGMIVFVIVIALINVPRSRGT